MVDRKKELFPEGAQTEEGRNSMINLFYTFASCRPRQFGVYRVYAAEELDELVATYEHDLCEAGEGADAEHLTRLAQAMYILKTGEYENIFWRVERRANELAAKEQLDIYNVTNILRAFSRGQHNRMCGQDKTFYRLESTVLKHLDAASDRDVSHLMYAYGIRGVGNPELHDKFLERLDEMADRLDYPSMFNVIYYMLFRDITDRSIWEKVISNVIEQDDALPLMYYKPFKIAKIYLENHFPDWDQKYLQDKLYHAEFYYD